jgi:hypothetical protein
MSRRRSTFETARLIHVKAGSNLLLSEAAHHANIGEERFFVNCKVLSA